jgi:hypothetical protein
MEQLEFQFGVAPLQQVRFLDAPPTRRIAGYIEPDLYNEVSAIAKAEHLEISAALNQLLTLAVRYYKVKQETPKPQPAEKTFYCQVCGKTCKTRYMHKAVVFSEEYKFCEACFFADKHKQFVITQITRM